MKSLKQFILEYRTTDEMIIYDNNKEVKPIRYAYDEESLKDFVDFYKKYSQQYIIKLCKLTNNKWQTLNDNGIIDFLKLNDNYYTQGKLQFTYQELSNELNEGKYILILLDK